MTDHIVEAQPSAVNRVVARATGLRNGMWVTVDGAVGILTALDASGAASVMLVNEDGTNKIGVVTSAFNTKQARRSEIPEKRRPSTEMALARGYF